MTKKMIKYSRKQNQPSCDPNITIPDQRILVHCSAGRGRTGTLITVFLIAEHLLNISESIFAGLNPRQTGFTHQRDEPDSFYIE